MTRQADVLKARHAQRLVQLIDLIEAVAAGDTSRAEMALLNLVDVEAAELDKALADLAAHAQRREGATDRVATRSLARSIRANIRRELKMTKKSATDSDLARKVRAAIIRESDRRSADDQTRAKVPPLSIIRRQVSDLRRKHPARLVATKKRARRLLGR